MFVRFYRRVTNNLYSIDEESSTMSQFDLLLVNFTVPEIHEHEDSNALNQNRVFRMNKFLVEKKNLFFPIQ